MKSFLAVLRKIGHIAGDLAIAAEPTVAKLSPSAGLVLEAAILLTQIGKAETATPSDAQVHLEKVGHPAITDEVKAHVLKLAGALQTIKTVGLE